MSDTRLSPGHGTPDAQPPVEQRTLYVAGMADPRDRRGMPREMPRGRAAKRHETTSDVRRGRVLLAAVLAAAAGAGVAMAAAPPPGGLGRASPGPLSRPHQNAKLECASCHATAEPKPGSPTTEALVPGACAKCHGAHPSTREGHRRAVADGRMGCPTCHGIHRSDQGVSFFPDADPVRFAPGASVTIDDVGYRPPRAVTVPLVPAGACAKCHAVDSPADPASRCVLPGQESLGGARPTVCFDEHVPALPPDAPASVRVGPRGPGRDRPEPGDRPSGVCSNQHATDRAVSWDAAREAAARAPLLTGSVGVDRRPLWWLGSGLGAAIVAVGLVHAAGALARSRKRAAERTAAPEAPAARVRLPTIDTNTCIGCYACVDACPYDVLEVERYVAVVARPEACCGLILCEQRCPNGSLTIGDGNAIADRPRLRATLESTDVPGLFLAGDVTGLPLIKNAIRQGSAVVDAIAESLEGGRRGDGVLDLVVIGAGPAGISAALRAKELGLSFEVIEQGSVAQSIKSFPRGKLVFDQPLELPVTGKLWLQESTKEELLVHWLRVVRAERLPIREDTRMTSIERRGDVFEIGAEPRLGGPPVGLRARRVLLAIGTRGQPRRLPFELRPDVESMVFYHLSDARSFEHKRVIVVGLGDVAMEAAIALCRQPGTTVTIVARGAGFRRGKSRNVDEVRRLRDAGRLRLLESTQVTDVTSGEVEVTGPHGVGRIPCDAVLVLIGNIPPWNTLHQVGVGTESEARDPGAAVPVQGLQSGPS